MNRTVKDGVEDIEKSYKNPQEKPTNYTSCFNYAERETTKTFKFLVGIGGTLVVQVSLTTVTRIRFWLQNVIWLKLTLSHVRRVLSSVTLPSIAGFLRIPWFLPVQTLDP